ncbi:MAG: MarC family protein [Thermofilaceae archaeon]|nr:MarC family protein [Thermofilaceae archaeon]MCX8180977.1 MarC family protein [Thermofilaceae archaeon]MDW8004082.1 MarC family protein [Thermofilaceae archaeon]
MSKLFYNLGIWKTVIEFVKQLWDAFAMLFVVLDSVGNVPLFYALTPKISEKEREKIFAKSVLIASLLLVLFALTGEAILRYYGVSVSDFKIAGGILLFLIAIQGMFGRIEAELLRTEDVVVVPMATPLLAGPGSIYTVVYLSAAYGLLPTLFSIALNTALAYLVLSKSSLLLAKAGRNTILALARIFSLLLGVIAVSIIRSGLVEVLKTLTESGI